MVLINSSEFSLEQNSGPLIQRVAIAMMIVSFVAMVLRFLARRLVRQPFLWDDWLIPIAVACSWGVAVIEIVAVQHGKYGQHIELATPGSIATFFKALYGLQIVYLLGIASIKFSILLFYRRLFKVPRARVPLIVIGLIVLACLITMLLMAIFSCKPVESFWNRNPAKPSDCINDIKYFIAVAAPNTATDLMLLIFPMPMIWNLKVNIPNRIALTVIFLVGGFMVVLSALRLVTIIQADGSLDVTWSLIPLGIFTVIEMNIGILCACLPSMTPLLRIMLDKSVEASNLPSKPQSKMATTHRRWLSMPSHQSLDSNNNSATWLKDSSPPDPGVGPHTKTIIHGGLPDQIEMHDVRQPIAGIRVDHDITWS